MKKIELCGVARAFVRISENGPQSKKIGHPWSRTSETGCFVKMPSSGEQEIIGNSGMMRENGSWAPLECRVRPCLYRKTSLLVLCSKFYNTQKREAQHWRRVKNKSFLKETMYINKLVASQWQQSPRFRSSSNLKLTRSETTIGVRWSKWIGR